MNTFKVRSCPRTILGLGENWKQLSGDGDESAAECSQMDTARAA
jgi:hypothetical protein